MPRPNAAARRNSKQVAATGGTVQPMPIVAGTPTDDVTDPLAVEVDGLRYSLDRAPPKGGRKVIINVRSASGGAGLVVDRVDLYAFSSRHKVATIICDTFGKTMDVVMNQLMYLLDHVERATQDEQESKPATVVLTPARKAAAEKLLSRPDLLGRVTKALDALGLVGERRNIRICYLTATSRLLPKPLSVILRAPAASGKSEILDRISMLMAPESVEPMSKLTPAALFYLGPDALRHKLVLVDEHVGASEAEHPIRVLQSSGKLTLATVVKGKTERFTISGPIALMSGATDQQINPENLSRCLELTLDDSSEQTQRIHEAQRRAWAGDEGPSLDPTVYQDAQRLLEPMSVVIPFAKKLRFPVRTTRDRRDQPKLLGLVAAHALLYQRQREIDAKGRLIATPADYRVAYELYAPLIEAEFEDLSPRAATLYRLLTKDSARTTITRREAAVLTGWSYTTTRRALDELVSHEILKLVSGETPIKYRVLDVPAVESTNLTPPDEVE